MSRFTRDFSKATIKSLALKGITIVGIQYIPDFTSSMPFANGTRGYVVSDNGTGRVWTHPEVLERAR